MNITDRIYIAGHDGMVGSAIVRAFERRGYRNFIFRTIAELDLRDGKLTEDLFRIEKPDIVILAAARVGGIQANIDHPAEFLYDNLVIQNNVIHQAHLNKVKKIAFLGSSCIYPRECAQPMKEEYLLTGVLEPTNEGYALAKIAGIKMIEYYRKQYGLNGISIIPCNLYGTNDSFNPRNSHVLSALVKKIVDAIEGGHDEVSMWGTGNARRELMHVDDAAEAIFFLVENYDDGRMINIGLGVDVSIRELAEMIAREAGYRGRFVWDTSKPDGMMRKCVDVARMRALGFAPKISLAEGIKRTVKEYNELKNHPVPEKVI